MVIRSGVNIRYQMVDFDRVERICITANECIREIAFRDHDLAPEIGSIEFLAIAQTDIARGVVICTNESSTIRFGRCIFF